MIIDKGPKLKMWMIQKCERKQVAKYIVCFFKGVLKVTSAEITKVLSSCFGLRATSTETVFRFPLKNILVTFIVPDKH